ncbi:Uncharacterised protein [Serratia liquefaciens]|jgi:hypothetical protein|uniref:hypothetical protein n=1 Tax=Serratia TaxID=613 RepID=UPI00095E7CC7|nr:MULTISPECIES: hypothetical protein [Serratia]MCS4316999.1 hypothetical protein [Serratia sp. BIGb0234]OKP17498.1 hypothetical protein BSQ35_20525 [Serratia liquefaciens]PVD44442.1 hypothetical protein C5188_08280 [Serratia liquefaciens]QHT50923.1 hypothetical protein C5686_011575 [Serratia liquefaciens]CAI2438816.1 Uncharacterised protein [Serratia liquefaciens]
MNNRVINLLQIDSIMQNIHYQRITPFQETAMTHLNHNDAAQISALPLEGLVAVYSKKQTLI